MRLCALIGIDCGQLVYVPSVGYSFHTDLHGPRSERGQDLYNRLTRVGRINTCYDLQPIQDEYGDGKNLFKFTAV
jgi:hypothetical protein